MHVTKKRRGVIRNVQQKFPEAARADAERVARVVHRRLRLRAQEANRDS